MGRYEASVRELFYRSCIADRCFIPQHDRGIGYVILQQTQVIGLCTLKIDTLWVGTMHLRTIHSKQILCIRR